ncbi:2OG-Fe(II) oxygenase [[Empedobacter] haloabium]|uniref:2OG-Fe(II) oxygenase n=1 Tax=[Empedobacter] haloabium TaxID=592317 RepID=A0ABZ1UH10_9BURK
MKRETPAADQAIQILDDIVPRELYRSLVESSLTLDWQFGWKTMSNPHMRYWHHEVGYGTKENTEDCMAQVSRHRLAVFGLYQTWLTTHVFPAGTRILRFYLNGHTYGSEGWPHTDSDRPGEVTTVLYLNEQWQAGWGGETVIYDAAGDIACAALPRPNRLVIFPSDRLHGPRPLSKAFDDLRVVLVVKVALPAADAADEHEPDPALVAFLRDGGCAGLAHSGRDLLTHLIGTYRILRRRGAAEAVCLAGLFHSIYGTSIMHCTLPLERAAVRVRIGEHAERLAWLFCMMDRPRCWALPATAVPLRTGARVVVAANDWRDLRLIEEANLTEQGVLDTRRWDALTHAPDTAGAQSDRT